MKKQFNKWMTGAVVLGYSAAGAFAQVADPVADAEALVGRGRTVFLAVAGVIILVAGFRIVMGFVNRVGSRK